MVTIDLIMAKVKIHYYLQVIMKLIINENKLITLILLISYLLIFFSSLHSEAEARDYCEKRQDYINPERGESCGIYEKGISMAGTVDHPTKHEIRNAKQTAINKSQDKIYSTLLSLAKRWSKVDLSTEEKEKVLDEFRKQLRVKSENHPCEKRGGGNKHTCITRSSLLLSDDSAKVEKIMNRIIALRSNTPSKITMPSKPEPYMAGAYIDEIELFSDTFSLKKKIRTEEILFSVHTVNLYFKKEDVDIRNELYLRNVGDNAVLSNEKKTRSERNEIVIVMKYPIQYMDITDQFHIRFSNKISYDETDDRAINENSFRLYNSADEPLTEKMTEKKWVPFEKINSYLPDQFIDWLNNSGYNKEFVLLITIKEDDFFEDYYVRKRIRFLNKCDKSKQLTQDVRINSKDLFIPDLISADDDGYYSISLPKSKWKESCELSVSAPDFHETTIDLDPFYKEIPLNTRNEIILVPNRKHVEFQITKAGNVSDNTFNMTYLVDSRRKMKLNLDFSNNDLFSESVAVSGGKKISSFDLKNKAHYKVNIVDHIRDPDQICDELIRLQIHKIPD
jgi:hypothetical protein